MPSLKRKTQNQFSSVILPVYRRYCSSKAVSVNHTFQSTLPQKGSDSYRVTSGAVERMFQSALLIKGANRRFAAAGSAQVFQSPLPMGSDVRKSRKARALVYFNRDEVTLGRVISIRTPAWGAIRQSDVRFCHAYISIRTPRVGSNHGRWKKLRLLHYFNPHSPRGERWQKPARIPCKFLHKNKKHL